MGRRNKVDKKPKLGADEEMKQHLLWTDPIWDTESTGSRAFHVVKMCFTLKHTVPFDNHTKPYNHFGFIPIYQAAFFFKIIAVSNQIILKVQKH